MTKTEVDNTRYGEMVSYINCYQIENGAPAKRRMSHDEIMRLG